MKAPVSIVVPSTTAGLTEEERLRQELRRIEDTDELSPVVEGGPSPEDEEPVRLSGRGGNLAIPADEPEGVITYQPPQEAPRQQQHPPQPAQPRQLSQAGDAAGEEVGWGDEQTMRLGDGLERIRPEKGSDKAVRFALLPFLKPRRTRIHWVQVGGGKVCRLCLAQGDTPGWCCTKLGEEGRYRVVVLAICYTNANPKTGGYTKLPDGSRPPVEWKIGYLDLSPSSYRTISELPDGRHKPLRLRLRNVHGQQQVRNQDQGRGAVEGGPRGPQGRRGGVTQVRRRRRRQAGQEARQEADPRRVEDPAVRGSISRRGQPERHGRALAGSGSGGETLRILPLVPSGGR